MNKIFSLILLFTNLAYLSFSQDSLVFRVLNKPSTKYSQKMQQTSINEVTYTGAEEFLKSLQAKGFTNPTVTKTESVVESEFTTGKLTDAAHFPVTMKFIKSINSSGKVGIPDGTVIFGKGSVTGMPTLDSIASNELSEEYKTNLLHLLRTTFSQILLPEKQIKVGEEFIQQTPLVIPIGGVNIEMNITTTYKLMSITNRIGNFDIVQSYTLKSNITKYTTKATGFGKGNLQYDIANSSYISYSMYTDFSIDLEHEKFNLNVKSKSEILQTTLITNN